MKRYSLLSRLRFLSAGILIAILVMPMAYQAYFSVKGEREKKEKLIHLIGEVSSKKISEYIIRNDIYSASNIVNTICDSLEMSKCEVKDNVGKIIYQYETEVIDESEVDRINLSLIYIGKNVGSLSFYYERLDISKLLISELPIFLLTLLLLPLVFLIFKKSIMITLKEVNEFFGIFESQSLKDTIKKLEESELSCIELDELKTNLSGKMKALDSSEDRIKESEKRASVGEVSRQLAHDLRSPLAALKAAMMGSNEMEANQKMLIEGSMGRIENITDSLLQKNSIPKREEKVEVENIILKMLSEKESQYMKKKDIKFQFNYSENSHLVNFPLVELERVFSNIIDNAVDSFDTNGKVTVSCYERNSNIEVVIQDNGCGIPEDLIEKVVQKNFSAGKENGTGLGLYHAHSKMKEYGGELKVISKKDFGTNISLNFPLG